MPGHWFRTDDCSIAALEALCATKTVPADYPLADTVEAGVVVYDAVALAPVLRDPARRRVLQGEWIEALRDGPGVLALRGAFPDATVVDRVTEAYFGLIAQQKAEGRAAGDHYAKPGANDRVWNALEKLAVADPDGFIDYYANDVLAAVCEAWLGPGYQMTSQVNVVNPGGEAQRPHPDYHLGFADAQRVLEYPAHVHAFSPLLTLQGAVAHCDMPLESGPTKYLPHSQKLGSGYVAYHLPEFAECFERHHVQLALTKGDAVFFNPSLLHAAGTNRSADIKRVANLVQVSSAFGRAMESIDRSRMVEALYPSLRTRRGAGMEEHLLRNALACAAEGYPFPTNLDTDQPIGSMAPASMAARVWDALAADASPATVSGVLTDLAAARASH